MQGRSWRNGIRCKFIFILALYIGAWTLGEFTGPLVGGNLMEFMSFERVTTLFGYFMLANTFVYFIYSYNHEQAKKNLKIQD